MEKLDRDQDDCHAESPGRTSPGGGTRCEQHECARKHCGERENHLDEWSVDAGDELGAHGHCCCSGCTRSVQLASLVQLTSLVQRLQQHKLQRQPSVVADQTREWVQAELGEDAVRPTPSEGASAAARVLSAAAGLREALAAASDARWAEMGGASEQGADEAGDEEHTTLTLTLILTLTLTPTPTLTLTLTLTL